MDTYETKSSNCNLHVTTLTTQFNPTQFVHSVPSSEPTNFSAFVSTTTFSINSEIPVFGTFPKFLQEKLFSVKSDYMIHNLIRLPTTMRKFRET